MRKISLLSFLLFIVITAQAQKSDTIPTAVKKLISAYPDFLAGYTGNRIIFKDGTTVLWNDGIKNKTPQQLLDSPDLKDMFIQSYKTGKLSEIPARYFDPGRIRNEPFFLKMYGGNEAAVRKHITYINLAISLTGN